MIEFQLENELQPVADEVDFEKFVMKSLEEFEKADQSDEKPKFTVHFYCSDCGIPWKMDVAKMINAVLTVEKYGCPLCNKKDKVYLTHHEEIVDEVFEEVNLENFIKFVPL